MNWKSTSGDGPPKEGVSVLISVDGVYYIAEYIKAENLFRVTLDDCVVDFPLENKTVYWTEFLNTPPV
jgi:hypothetical protein